MRKLAFVAFVFVVVAWWRAGDDRAPTAHAVRTQAAVLADGFAMLVGHDARRVIELDRHGKKQHEMPLKIDREVRLVGTRAGTTIGYQNGKKLELASLDSEGNIDEKSSWGKKVTQLCQGAATNEYRFAVGWLESDGRVWFVHGPLRRALDGAVEAASVGATAKVTWCGITSAEALVVLFWRDGNRLMMNACGPKQCSSLVVKVPIDASESLLGFGCVRDACLLATRDKQGNTKLHRVNERGRSIVKVLEHAANDTAVTIASAGSQAFVVGYMAKDNLATVHRVTTDLAFTGSWQFEGVRQPPALASVDDRVLVALPSGEAHVIELSR